MPNRCQRGDCHAGCAGHGSKQLLVNSDIAVPSQGQGESRLRIFSEEMQQRVVLTSSWPMTSCAASRTARFTAYYQPKVHAVTRQIVGMERSCAGCIRCKVCWGLRRFGSGRRAGAVSTIDRMVFEQALAQFGHWQERGLGIPFRVGQCLSMRRLNDHELLESLRGFSQTPGTVSFELLESIFLDDTDEGGVAEHRASQTLGH